MMRRLRGIIGNAITWGIAWGVLGFVGGVVEAVNILRTVAGPRGGLVLGALVGNTAFAAAWGAIAGGAFAVIVSIAERKRTLQNISVARVALWGALGGALLPLLNLGAALALGGAVAVPPSLPIALGFSAFAGGLCAAGSVALARRASGSALGDGAAMDAIGVGGWGDAGVTSRKRVKAKRSD